MKTLMTTLTIGLLSACISTKSDDTAGEDNENNNSEPSETTDTDDTDEPVAPPSGFTPDAVFFDVSAVIQSNTIGTVTSSDGSEFSGSFAIYIADSANWSGTDDVENACALIFNMTPDSATYDASFETAGAWLGFSFPAMTNYVGATDSCEDMDADYQPLIARWSNAGFSVGIGPSNPDDLSSLQEAVNNAGPDAGDWATDWLPYITQAFVKIDGLDIDGDGNDDPYFVNFTRSYKINDDGTLATADEDGNADPNGQYLLRQEVVDADGSSLTYAIDGYYAGFPWAGLNADFFLQ